MDAAIRLLVWERAANRCEYCRLHQDEYEYQTFHVEHIIAKQHGGDDDLFNLAWSCDRCNLFKGPNLSCVDDETGQIILLFHPRRDVWSDHFTLQGALIVGRTATGRATAAPLQMNAPRRRDLRALLLRRGDW